MKSILFRKAISDARQKIAVPKPALFKALTGKLTVLYKTNFSHAVVHFDYADNKRKNYT